MNILSLRNGSITAWFIAIMLFLASGQSFADNRSYLAPNQLNPMVIIATSDEYAGLDVVNLEEMSEMRGGFSIGGLNLKFGATLSTLIDNIKLETVFNITSAGAEIVSQMLSNLGIMNEAVDALANNHTVNNNSETSSTVTPATTAVLVGPKTGVSVSDLAPVDVNLDGLNSAKGFSGVVVSNNKGFTAALHKLTQSAAISAIISNASGLKASQKLDIRINIENAKSAAKAAKASALSRGIFRSR